MASGYTAAASLTNLSVGLTGMEGNGTGVYVGISPNLNSCKNGGIYFQDPAELDKALSIALSAKMAGKTVRIDVTQPGGAGSLCFGYGIYVH